MKKSLIIILGILSVSFEGSARDTVVRGYYRKNGTYVNSYHRSTPDKSINNNYGTKGNLNVWTGESGTRPRKANDASGEYNLGNGQGEAE